MAKRDEFSAATRRAASRRAAGPVALAARYDRCRDRVVVRLNTGLELAFPPHIAQGLDKAKPGDLSEIEMPGVTTEPDDYWQVILGQVENRFAER